MSASAPSTSRADTSSGPTDNRGPSGTPQRVRRSAARVGRRSGTGAPPGKGVAGPTEQRRTCPFQALTPSQGVHGLLGPLHQRQDGIEGGGGRWGWRRYRLGGQRLQLWQGLLPQPGELARRDVPLGRVRHRRLLDPTGEGSPPALWERLLKTVEEVGWIATAERSQALDEGQLRGVRRQSFADR